MEMRKGDLNFVLKYRHINTSCNEHGGNERHTGTKTTLSYSLFSCAKACMFDPGADTGSVRTAGAPCSRWAWGRGCTRCSALPDPRRGHPRSAVNGEMITSAEECCHFHNSFALRTNVRLFLDTFSDNEKHNVTVTPSSHSMHVSKTRQHA